MTTTLIISCGAADTRAALLDGDRVVRFWFGPARGDEAADPYPACGRRFIGRVSRVDNALGAAFIDIGAGDEGFLPLPKGGDALTEGDAMAVEIRTEPRRKKGPVLKLLGLVSSETEPTGQIDDAAVLAARALGPDGGAVIVDDGAAKQALERAGMPNVQADNDGGDLWRRHLDGELEMALAPRVNLAGGGALIIDENEALTAIDVDAGALQGASSKRLREKTAYAAAEEAMRQIVLRNIGGHVVIDFPPLENARDRRAFEDHVRSLAKNAGGAAASFSKSGLFSFRRPRAAASLLDRFTEDDDGSPVPGRRLTLHASALAAIRALEAALKSERASRFVLTCGATLYDYAGAHAAWSERLAARYGARFAIRRGETMEERGFDLSQQ